MMEEEVINMENSSIEIINDMGYELDNNEVVALTVKIANSMKEHPGLDRIEVYIVIEEPTDHIKEGSMITLGITVIPITEYIDIDGYKIMRFGGDRIQVERGLLNHERLKRFNSRARILYGMLRYAMPDAIIKEVYNN